jgi:hypothetical protein
MSVSHQANAALCKDIFQSRRRGASIRVSAAVRRSAVILEIRTSMTAEDAEVQEPISRQAE